MNTWSAEHNSCSAVGARLPAATIAAIGRSELPQVLFEELNQFSGFACLVAGTITAAALPVADWTASGGTDDFARTCTQIYAPDFAIADPTRAVRQRLLHGGNDGEILVSRVSADDISNTRHRACIYERFGLRERWCIAQRLAPGEAISLTLLKRGDQCRLTPVNVEVLLGLAPVLLALLRRHRELASARSGGGSPLRDRLQARCPDLTVRELELCLQLLAGRTLHAIAVEWQVMPSTVETYRARAYRKLGIHFRNQLFALAGNLS